MVKTIIISPNAMEDYQKTVFYLISEWNEKIARKFDESILSHTARIVRFPEIGMRSRQDGSVRSVLLSKHARLYYRRLAESVIEFASIFDTRQDPVKNPYY